MKKSLIFGAVMLLGLTSCTSPFVPKKTDGVEIINEHPEVPQNSNPFEPTTDPPAVSIYTGQEPILCKIRRYHTGAIMKSDLIVQADGSVWCGFYEQNEGTIGTDNVLRKSDGTECELVLMDDLWLDAFLTETAEDDFMLFGETDKLGTLPPEMLAELINYAINVSPDKAYTGNASADSSVTDYYYADVVSLKSEEKLRVPAMAQLGNSKLMSSDADAKKIIETIMNSSFYSDWEKLCDEKFGL